MHLFYVSLGSINNLLGTALLSSEEINVGNQQFDSIVKFNDLRNWQRCLLSRV